MLTISQEDRIKLIQLLEAEIPSTKPPLRDLLSLLLTLLHDQQRVLDMERERSSAKKVESLPIRTTDDNTPLQ